MYRDEVFPKAEGIYWLSLEAFKGGQFEYLRVIQSQGLGRTGDKNGAVTWLAATVQDGSYHVEPEMLRRPARMERSR